MNLLTLKIALFLIRYNFIHYGKINKFKSLLVFQ